MEEVEETAVGVEEGIGGGEEPHTNGELDKEFVDDNDGVAECVCVSVAVGDGGTKYPTHTPLAATGRGPGGRDKSGKGYDKTRLLRGDWVT